MHANLTLVPCYFLQDTILMPDTATFSKVRPTHT